MRRLQLRIMRSLCKRQPARPPPTAFPPAREATRPFTGARMSRSVSDGADGLPPVLQLSSQASAAKAANSSASACGLRSTAGVSLPIRCAAGCVAA